MMNCIWARNTDEETQEPVNGEVVQGRRNANRERERAERENGECLPSPGEFVRDTTESMRREGREGIWKLRMQEREIIVGR